MNSYFNINWILATLWCFGVVWPAAADDVVSFRRDVAPILLDHCVACHNAKQAEGGYRLDTFAEFTKAGDSGIDPLVGQAEEHAELLKRLITDDEFERMPAESAALAESQIRLISDWVEAGANFDGEDTGELLAFVVPPPRHPPPPPTYARALEVTALAFSPDGLHVVGAGYHEILVWDLQGNLIRRIENIGQRTFDLAWHPDGKRLAVAGGQPGRYGEVRLIDFESGEVQAVLGRSTDVVWDVAFRPGADEIAIASADKSIRIFDLSTFKEQKTLLSHADWVTAIAWNADGTRLLSASRDRSAKVFDGDSGDLQVSYGGHGAAVRGVSLSSDGKQAFTVGGDKKLHRWNLADAKKIAEVPLGGEGFRLVQADGLLWVACSDHRLVKVDSAKNTVTGELTGHADWVLTVAMNRDQSLVVTGASDGEIRLWNVSSGKLLANWDAVVREAP
ncbi:MAG: hypothetical protein P8L85_07190 [Rubripirellula sp.]|nr:hypothetical protein [Rubripirellula sp.]